MSTPEYQECGVHKFYEVCDCNKLHPWHKLNTKGDTMKEDGITNLEVTDMPDGSAKVTMDLTPETQRILMKQGLEYLIEEMKVKDEVVVMEPNDFSEEAKTWELSDDEYNALFHFGFISALRIGMEGLENE